MDNFKTLGSSMYPIMDALYNCGYDSVSVSYFGDGDGLPPAIQVTALDSSHQRGHLSIQGVDTKDVASKMAEEVERRASHIQHDLQEHNVLAQLLRYVAKDKADAKS